MIIEQLLYWIPAPFTGNYFDLLVFFYATKMLLQGMNPYNVPPNAPWIYSNPLPYPQWFAYPPLALIIWALMSLPLWLTHTFNMFTFRIIDKITVILAVFWIAKRMEDIRKGSYKYVVFNPLFWIATSIHGMLDSIATALFVEAMWRLFKKDDKYWIFYSLSLVTKQITWITIPAMIGYWIKEKKYRDMILSVALSLIIVLPFLSPGFIQNVLSFHGERPPASLGYTGVPLIFVAGDASSFHIANVVAPCFGKPLPKPGVGSYVLSLAFVIVLLWSLLKSLEGKFLGGMALASLGFILFSKVISPQNLLLPFVIFLMVNAPYKWLLLPSAFAGIVDLSIGTSYGMLGYLAEDVLNRLGTSIVHIYRSLGGLRFLLTAPALPSLLAYHVSVILLVYMILKNRVSKKWFVVMYIVYLGLVVTSVSTTSPSPVPVMKDGGQGRVAVIWIWLNPLSGMKAGDYLWMRIDPHFYWEYTYPLVLKTLDWLKSHNFTTVGLVYSTDREDLYEYVPWLFGIIERHMKFVWVLVPPTAKNDYINGWASYPFGANVTEILKRMYKLTPIYINNKIKLVRKVLNNTNILSTCPLRYLSENGKAIVYVYGNVPNVSLPEVKLVELPRSAVLINDFYKGHVLWGTPITPKKGQ